MSAAAEKAQATTPMMEIPVVNINVPDYPDREPRGGATSRAPLKPSQAAKQGLTAPIADVSSSGRVMMIIFSHLQSLLSFTPAKKILYCYFPTFSLSFLLWSTKDTKFYIFTLFDIILRIFSPQHIQTQLHKLWLSLTQLDKIFHWITFFTAYKIVHF